MSYLMFIFKSALEDFRRNKMRTFLTSLGILIGVSSVVLLISFGLGLKKFISDQFESLGTNLVIVLPGKVFQNGQFRQGGPAVSTARFDEKDITSLKKIKNAKYVVPVFTKTVAVSGAGTTEYYDLFASNADIFPTRNLEVAVGRAFEKSDLDKRSKVVTIGPKVAEKIFGSVDAAIGKPITIQNQNYFVIGILKSKGGGGFGGPDFDSFIYVPYKSVLSLNPDKKFLAFYLKAIDQDSIPGIKEDASSILLRRYDDEDFSIAEQTEILNAISSIFGVFNIVLVAIAAISLIVGGIGIMNIMFVSVIERIREIGIRRAIGARRLDILLMFLTEAVLLSLIGGMLGLGLSFLVVSFIQRFFPAYIDLASVLSSLGVSSAVGVIFGVAPAKKAADLSPIEAIRYE